MSSSSAGLLPGPLPPEAGNNIYYQIAEPYRGRGYGKILMTMALAEAKRIGLHHVRLTVLDDNPTSRHIIESHGAVWLRDFVCAQGRRYHLFEIRLRRVHGGSARDRTQAAEALARRSADWRARYSRM